MRGYIASCMYPFFMFDDFSINCYDFDQQIISCQPENFFHFLFFFLDLKLKKTVFLM